MKGGFNQMARISMNPATVSTIVTEEIQYASVSSVRVVPVSSYPQVIEPPMTWLIPTAHQTHMPETYMAITAGNIGVASAYNVSHSSTGSLSATVDSGALANFFRVPPTKLYFYHSSNVSSSGIYRVAMWSACTGVAINDTAGLLARAQWVYIGQPGYTDPVHNISARAVFEMNGTPIGQTGTSANGMVYFGW